MSYPGPHQVPHNMQRPTNSFMNWSPSNQPVLAAGSNSNQQTTPKNPSLGNSPLTNLSPYVTEKTATVSPNSSRSISSYSSVQNSPLSKYQQPFISNPQKNQQILLNPQQIQPQNNSMDSGIGDTSNPNMLQPMHYSHIETGPRTVNDRNSIQVYGMGGGRAVDAFYTDLLPAPNEPLRQRLSTNIADQEINSLNNPSFFDSNVSTNMLQLNDVICSEFNALESRFQFDHNFETSSDGQFIIIKCILSKTFHKVIVVYVISEREKVPSLRLIIPRNYPIGIPYVERAMQDAMLDLGIYLVPFL